MQKPTLGLVLAAGVVLAASALAASATATGTRTAKSGGQITVADPLAPTTLDPISGASGGDYMSLYPIYDRLVNFDPKTLAPEPGLATSWKYTQRKTLVLTLRGGVKFQDGTPFNAAAVKFNLERAATLSTSVVKTDISSIRSIDVIGPLKVKLNLNKPDASLVLTLADRAGMMVSPAAVNKWGTSFGQHPVGTGPFVFVSYAPGDQMVVKKNAKYWQAGKPYLDQITFKYFTDQQTSDNALKSHQADVSLNVPASDVSALKSVSGLSVVSRTSLLTDGCYMNSSRPALSSVFARQAVASAIDRRALSSLLTFGLAVPTAQVFPSGYWASDPKLVNPFQFNQAKAKSLLAQSGHPNGLSIKAMAFNNSAEIRKGQIIQQQLKDVGINMSLDVTDVPTVAKSMFTDKSLDMVCASWSGRPDPSQTASSLFAAKSFYNSANYSPPGMAQALWTASSAQDQAKRAAGFSKVSEINEQNIVWLPLLSEPNNTAIWSNIAGLVPNLAGKIDVSFLSRS